MRSLWQIIQLLTGGSKLYLCICLHDPMTVSVCLCMSVRLFVVGS